MPSSFDKADDAELVRASRRGDRPAYGALVDRYLRRVYSVAVRIVCDTQAAEDVAQDTFVRALERLHQYDDDRPFGSWLLKIATNLALNHLRATKRDRLLRQRAAEADLDATETAAPSGDKGEANDWSRWLSKLEEPQRLSIVLFHFHEMPYEEIANVLGLPINTVRTHLHRGRKRLRELMSAGRAGEGAPWNVAMSNG